MNKSLKSVGYDCVDYDQKYNFLSKCEDIELEAKRVLLNEELAIMAIVPFNEKKSRENVEKFAQKLKESLNSDNGSGGNVSNAIKTQSEVCIISGSVIASVNKDSVSKRDDNKLSNSPPGSSNNYLIKEYFNIWRKTIKTTNQNDMPSDTKADKYAKLDKLIKRIRDKTQDDNKLSNSSSDLSNIYLIKKYFNLWRKTIKSTNQNDTPLDTKEDKHAKLDKLIKRIKKFQKQESTKNTGKPKEITKPIKSPNRYKNRFNAQKRIIDMQKTKLQEQTKVIEELQLGIIREDLVKSLNNTKTNIREIFSNCSEKVKCKVPILLLDENKQFAINSQKAPKVVQHMERRALERLQNRQIILERKRLIEEARQKALEEAIEKKRTLEDEERKKNLHAMKERRKKELELEKLRQEQREKYMKSLNKAIQFHNKSLLENCFNTLYSHFIECKKNERRARVHYESKVLKRCICVLWGCVEQKYVVKYNLADAHFAYKILKKTMKIWHEYYMENVRNLQVAEDICDFHLTSRTFVHWHRYVCSQIVLRHKNMKVAENHYKRKILLHYYYQWRSLPAVLQLEKAKELKKQKWREKVWEILPDYKPPDDI